VRFHLGTIRGIGDPDSYIKPEQPQSSIPPAKINISLSMPFDKLPEDVQNQILPMLDRFNFFCNRQPRVRARVYRRLRKSLPRLIRIRA
jgi:hypothetical protein